MRGPSRRLPKNLRSASELSGYPDKAASAIREREVVRSHASYITSCAFAVASSPRRPAIAARKLSIARLSGNAAGALAFVEVFRAAFERGFFEIGIFVSPQSYGADYDSAFRRVLPDIIIERDLPGTTGVFRSWCRGRWRIKIGAKAVSDGCRVGRVGFSPCLRPLAQTARAVFPQAAFLCGSR